jgi:hypothetical protein
MTGSPFSNVIGKDPGSSTFQDVESTQVGDTTSETAGRPADTPGESSVGVERSAAGDTHVAGEDETAGQTDTSGTDIAGA